MSNHERKPDQPGGDPEIHAPQAVPDYGPESAEKGPLIDRVFNEDGVLTPRYKGDMPKVADVEKADKPKEKK